jgi:cobyrinic acid a,c-diamide synthase
MSVPRLVVCGLESGPSIALAAGALTACFGDQRDVRPVTIGLDLPLWQLLCASAAKAPRVLDLAMHDDDTAAELYDSWAAGCELLLLVGVEPVLDRWQGVKGSRAVDVAAGLDAPLLLVVDARDRGPTVAAAVYGVRALAKRVEIAGVILVGGEDHGPGADLAASVRHDAGLPIVGWIPQRLSEQFARDYGFTFSAVRQIGLRPGEGSAQRLCVEAATYLQRDEIDAAASRRGFLPGRPRRLLTPAPAATGLTLAVAWGPPLEPIGLENVDLLQAMGLTLSPFDLTRDRDLPPHASGLLLAGQLDQDQLPGFAANSELHTRLADAVDDGLPTLALGGGALLLLRRLADGRGRSHELAGVLPAEAELLDVYERPRYVRARAARENPYDEGENLLYELFDLEYLVLELDSYAYNVGDPGETGQAEGFALGRCLATTLLPSLPRCPGLAERFVDAMRSAGPRA